MNTKKVFILILTIVLASNLYAQSNKDDTEFIKKLIESGYYDLAKELCDRIDKDANAPKEAKNNIKLLKAEILGKIAETETASDKAKEYLQSAVEQMKAFISENPNSPLIIDTKIQIGTILLRHARLTVSIMKEKPEPEKAAAISQEADKLFDEAETCFRALAEELKKAGDPKQTKGTILKCKYELARSLYEHALSSSGEKKEKILDSAIKLIVDEIEFIYMDFILGYESGIIGGLCYKEKANFNEAEKQYNLVISLKERLDADKTPLDDYTIEVISRAYLFKAQLFAQIKKFNKAIETVNEMLKLSPGVNKTPLGLTALFEKVKALEQAGNKAQAIIVANQMLELDSSGRWTDTVKEKISQLVSNPSSGNVDMDKIIANVDWLISINRYSDAIASLRNLILSVRTESNSDKILPTAYNKLGLCYLATGRFYEASFLFETVFTLFPQDKLAPKAAFQAARCLSTEYTYSDNPTDQEKYKQYLEIILTKYPNDPVAGNTQYLAGEQSELKGDLRGAIELYKKVPETADAYERALLQASYCLYQLGNKAWYEAKAKGKPPDKNPKDDFVEAESILKKVIQKLTDPSVKISDPEQIKYRDELRFIAINVLSLLYLHEAMNKPQELMQVVQEAEKTAGDDPSRLIQINIIKARTYVALEKIEESDQLLTYLLEKSPDTPQLGSICREVAAGFDTAAAKLEKNKSDVKKANLYYAKAGQYYLKWIDFSSRNEQKLSPSDIQGVTDRLYVIGGKINEIPENIESFADIEGKNIANTQFFTEAGFIYAKLLAGEYGQLKKDDTFKITIKLARCYTFLRSWTDAKRYYEMLIKSENLIDKNGRIATDIFNAKPSLLSVYQELGFAYLELSRSGTHSYYDSALMVFSNILGAVAKESKVWWMSKYYCFEILYERGNETDLKQASIGVDNLQRNYPDFDGGKYGMKEKFMDLAGKLKDKLPTIK